MKLIVVSIFLIFSLSGNGISVCLANPPASKTIHHSEKINSFFVHEQLLLTYRKAPMLSAIQREKKKSALLRLYRTVRCTLKKEARRPA
jgi:hypothetical protein